ncbi:CBN-RHR-1 protein [Aphelenchoides avenae]|nr:CBN-RHR-1 protein [Aphelenchus avenae]
MVHVANSTLAGGVAIGATANVVMSPTHALLVGCVAGLISVLGFEFLSPILTDKLSIHDTCGVNNLHGMPGVLAGLASVLFVYVYPSERLATVYTALRSPVNPGGRDVPTQAMFQLAALGLALLSSLVTGAITGLILRLPIWNQVRDSELYSDSQYFKTPEDFEATYGEPAKTSHSNQIAPIA